MRANVINFHHVLNYGAVFQGYALCEFLNKNGHEAKLIDYRPFYFLSRTYRPAKGFGKSYRKYKMNRNFLDFRKKHFKLTKEVFLSAKKLTRHYEGSKDAFICGSDQVWNANITNGTIDPGYFLDFVPDSGRKIAYAASIGHTKFNRANKTEIAKKLRSYSSISVREDFAKQEVLDITDNAVDPFLVLDPTLLLEDYTEVLDYELVPIEDYMVIYTTENSDSFRDYIRRIYEHLGIKAINLGHYDTGIDSVDYTNIHPCQWLGLFAKATYVCTNSFHGTAFSIVFNRNFTVLGRETMRDLNRRQLTLMGGLGLENRFLYNVNDFDVNKHFNDINFVDVKRKLEEQRKSSAKFLFDALS
ncbi:polysaccharide pyruvyl transferase family protein [uncultured Maribacter sp.]|uniref:polysaccharide pyruvyl transferase family protein n=1 Tax=uncultured Maribacter sp. TaxID=431308 RepID=UPI0030DA536A|tara:strand:- start:12533 stop:13606 length:1074 start_codon:yes stop_codon:yes gene_type:complete